MARWSEAQPRQAFVHRFISQPDSPPAAKYSIIYASKKQKPRKNSRPNPRPPQGSDSGARHQPMTDHPNDTPPDNLENLRLRLAEFAANRDWDQFHSPKNLAMALIAEAAELVEHFQWLTEDQSRALPPKTHEEVRLELADILIYLIRVADKLDVDLIRAANDKIRINNERYPADKVRGSPRRPMDPAEIVSRLLKGEV